MPTLESILPPDPGELAVVEAAIRAYVATITYWGQSVGSYVSDDEYRGLTSAAVQAINNYRNSKPKGT